MEKTDDGKFRFTQEQKRIELGCFSTKAEALQALSDYNEDPYDVHADTITFREMYEMWYEEHVKDVSPNAARVYKSAFSYFGELYEYRVKDLRVRHLEQAIDNSAAPPQTRERMKSLLNMLYAYAMKHEIVDKDYAHLMKTYGRTAPEIVRIPFTKEEVGLLWENRDFPYVDMVLTGIYTGFRPQEIAILKCSDVDIDQGTITGGLKTEAGRNRVVPIHHEILDIIKRNLSDREQLFYTEKDEKMSYDRYRRRWEKVMTHFGMKHTMHDTRHTFITNAKNCGMNEYMLKLIVGHAIKDVTEKVYTHRTIEQLKNEMEKYEIK